MEAIKYIESQKKKKKIKKTIALLIILIGLMLLFLIKAPIFNINDIIIENKESNLVSEESINGKISEVIGENIFYVKRKDIENKLKVDPYIKSLNVIKTLPNKVTVQIEENKKTFAIKKDNYFYIFDENGKFLDINYEIDKEKTIAIEGVEIESKEIGETISNDEKLLNIIESFGILFVSNKSEIKFTTLNLTDLSKIKLYYNDVEIKVGGAFDLERKLNYAINTIKNTDMDKGYIDVSMDGNPVIK